MVHQREHRTHEKIKRGLRLTKYACDVCMVFFIVEGGWVHRQRIGGCVYDCPECGEKLKRVKE